MINQETDSKDSQSTQVIIPHKGQGLWITAICGHGCKESIGDVYVLTEEEYGQHRKGNSKIEIRGKTPLLLTGIKPGIYYVGVKVPIYNFTVNLNFLPPRTEFFVADIVTEALLEVEIKFLKSDNQKLTANDIVNLYSLERWYKVLVEGNFISPVVALFLDEKASLDDWQQFYPKDELFRPAVPERVWERLWELLALKPMSIRTTSEQRAKVISLLKRGGKVCLPQSRDSAVIWLDGNGMLMVKGIASGELVEINIRSQ